MASKTNLDSEVQTNQVNDMDAHPLEEMDSHGVVVKLKWRGTSQDQMDMVMLGRHQTLRVREDPS